MKNFELPANEIVKASPVSDLFELASDEDFSDESDVFPATFKITETLIKTYFTFKGVDLATIKTFDSESNGDEREFPAFENLIHQFDFNPKSDDLYFEYGWSYNYTHIYEITINNKPALLFDIADGTSSTNFTMLQLVFAS